MRLAGATCSSCNLYEFFHQVASDVHQCFYIILYHTVVGRVCASCGVFSPLGVLDAIRTLYLLSVTWRRRGICLLSLWTAGWPPKSGFLAVFLMRHTTTMTTMQAMRKTPAQ